MLNQYANFTIFAPEILPTKGKIILRYALDDKVHFAEQIIFQQPFNELDEDKVHALYQAACALSLAAGVSYYKTYVPPKIQVQDIPITPHMASFFSNFYYEGLGEFACRNGLDIATLKQATKFTPNTHQNPQTSALNLNNRPCVLVGGGKDSLVSVEAIKESSLKPLLLGVNSSAAIIDCMNASNCDNVCIERRLDSQLFELNKQGAYNGHVPVTGILSFIAVTAAIIQNFDTIVLSNERSANEETTVYQGIKVNHQLSKSFKMEQDIAMLIKQYISTSIDYFSFLRPLSELNIAQLFKKTDTYDGVFTSCNGAHKLTSAHNKQWCLDCPKCHFTFLMLATALPLARLLHIFGENFLDNPDKLMAYKELCGLHGHKPWECVGELEEAAAAIWYLSESKEWQDTLIVKSLKADLIKLYPDLPNSYQGFMTPTVEHALPEKYKSILHDYMGE